ncbi:MAG: hypothetical protein JOZ19_14035 [Rubrobacter sp.]|nr:hypothetical protein [Rubrobacter sp.]
MEDDVQDSTGQEADMVQDNKMSSSSNMQRDTGQGNQHNTARASGNKVSVYEAAHLLGVTVDAIRKRIQRGKIPHQRDADGRVWILLDMASIVPDESENMYRTGSRDELVDSLKDQVEYLRQVIDTRNLELQRKDSIIAALTRRIPELEPAGPSSGTNQTPDEGPEGVVEPAPYTEGSQEKERRSWWRRFMGR